MVDAIHIILVVEADLMVRFVITDALLDAGFDALAVSTATEAISVFEPEPTRFRALITNVSAADDKSTWVLARRVRELQPTIPVIYLTSDSSGQWRSQGVPGSVLLQKPFAPAQVVTALSTLINSMDGASY